MKRRANAAYVRKDPEKWRNAGWTSTPNSITRDPDIPPDECWAWTWLASFSEEIEVSGQRLYQAKKCLGRNRAYDLLNALERRGLLLRYHAWDEEDRVAYVQYDLQPAAVPENERTCDPARVGGRSRGPHPGSRAAREAAEVENDDAPQTSEQRIPGRPETPTSGEVLPGRSGETADQRIPDRAGMTSGPQDEGGTSRTGSYRQGGSSYKEEKTRLERTNPGGGSPSPVGHPSAREASGCEDQPAVPAGSQAPPPQNPPIPPNPEPPQQRQRPPVPKQPGPAEREPQRPSPAAGPPGPGSTPAKDGRGAPDGRPLRCPTHAALGPDEDCPPCRHCAYLREQHEKQLADDAAAVEAERLRMRQCGMCDADGKRLDTRDGRRYPLTPYRGCDHRTPLEVVLAEIADEEERREQAASDRQRGHVETSDPMQRKRLKQEFEAVRAAKRAKRLEIERELAEVRERNADESQAVAS